MMRKRKGRILPFIFGGEDEALSTIIEHAIPGSTIYADEASCWYALHSRFAAKRINHSVTFKDEDACTNQAESYFSRLRRAEIGTDHHVSGPYLHSYAREMAWREDTRRKPNGMLYVLAASAALTHPVSR